MRKTVLLMASMTSAMLVACLAAALMALPGSGRTAAVTLVGAGDIARCSAENRDAATAKLLGNIPGTVMALGDNVYPYGTAENFRKCYDPTWGKYKRRTMPAVGNHEYYHTTAANRYLDYFGARAGCAARTTTATTARTGTSWSSTATATRWAGAERFRPRDAGSETT
jgi:hypothetical protein